MKVIATQMGIYENARVREGEVIVLKNPEKEFSANWMEPAEGETLPKSAKPAYVKDPEAAELKAAEAAEKKEAAPKPAAAKAAPKAAKPKK